MDRFDSCYFCGEAFDASLAEYPVVPKELQPTGDGPAVVLCGTCRRKLGAVVEEVVTATRGASAADAATTRQAEAADSPATNGAEPADASGESLLDDSTDDTAATDTDESTTTTADEWESPASDDGDEPDSADRDDGEAPTERDTGATAPASGDGAADSASPEDDGSGEDPTLTKLEYNKVMRLLQNRPFPVDRGEIREVATSAYDIDPEEFDAVVEAAVSRGLIAVENGQFVDPQ